MSALLLLATALGWGMALHLRVELGRRAVRTARACHEVRGPLTAAGLALHAAGRRGAAAGSPVLGAVEGELARAARAVEDLLRAGAPVREPVDLVALIAARGPAWEALAGRIVLRVPDGGPVWVRGDATRLAQALANLVANATRHGAPPVEVDVRRAGDRVLVGVRDHGPGLPAPIERLAARRSRGRHGHGLRVVVDVAADHDGALRSARSDEGAHLVLDLPSEAAAVKGGA